MKTDRSSSSKEQEQQAQKNKQKEETSKHEAQIDKKMEGPNRPSV